VRGEEERRGEEREKIVKNCVLLCGNHNILTHCHSFLFPTTRNRLWKTEI